MIFVYIMSIAIGMLWGLRMILERRFIWRSSPFDVVLWTFLLSQVLSTIFSMHPRTSWFGYYTRFNGGLLSTITFIGLFHAFLANLNKQQVKAILTSLLLSVLLVSAWAIPEKFGHSVSCFLINTDHAFNTACWTDNNNPRDRVFASFGQPNWLAAFLIALIPLALQQLITNKSWSTKAYLGAVLLSGSTALWLSKSRSGLLGLALGLGVYFGVKVLRNQSKRMRLWLIGGAMGLGVLIFFWGSWWSRPLAINQTIQAGTPSEDIRKIVWEGALKVWLRYPILGSGVETFAYSYYLDRPLTHNLVSEWDFLYNKAHNELLNTLATSGLFGLLSYLAIFAGLAWYLKQQKPNDQNLSLVAGIVGLFVSNFFGFSTVMTNLLLFGFLAMIVIESEKTSEDHLSESEIIDRKVKSTITEYIIAAILIILGCVFSLRVWNIWYADFVFTRGQTLFSKGNYQAGLALSKQAIELSPKEALFYDELSGNYADVSLALANSQQATASAEFARAAIASNQTALELNPHHLNFYKSQARLYIRLGQLDSRLYSHAKEALEQALLLAPTDAKLYYNLGLVLEVLGQKDQAIETMEHTVAIKPNYLQARNELARMYFVAGQLEKAQALYRSNLRDLAPGDALIQEKLDMVTASISAKNQ